MEIVQPYIVNIRNGAGAVGCPELANAGIIHGIFIEAFGGTRWYVTILSNNQGIILNSTLFNSNFPYTNGNVPNVFPRHIPQNQGNISLNIIRFNGPADCNITAHITYTPTYI